MGDYGKPTRVPSIPDVRTGNAAQALEAIKEWIEVRQGSRGDGLDRAVTFRDLLNSGIATPGAIKGLGGIDIPPIPLDPDDGSLDPATPPTPTNLVAAGAIRSIILTWDFARGYSRFAYFEVWRSQTNSLGDAVAIAQVYEPMYVDETGPGAKFYYWVRAFSDAGHSNFNAVEGTLGETAPNIEEIIVGLEGEIRASHLHKSLGERIDTTELLVGQVDAAVRQEVIERTTATTALAQQLTTVGAKVDDNIVAVQNEMTARIDETGRLFAQYTVKLDVNGRVSGFGLASEPNLAGQDTSTFAVRADRFYIAPPGSTDEGDMPFIVQTTATTINGVSVPPGVYMRNAYIMNGAIDNAKIGNLAVDDAKIASMNVSKLRAGKLSVGAYIESTNYQSGKTGFIIHANGNAEFQNATVRGTVYATSGTIGGVIIDGGALTTTNYNGSTAGWSINSNGNVHFSNGTFRGHITATSGTFSGSLQAATGTFKGALDAATGTFAGRVHGGYFTAGSFTGYSWPFSGTGVYLGPEGLLMGNWRTGRWFEVTSDGSYMAMPGMHVQNGVLTITAANVIDTLQLRGGAVSTTYASGFSGTSQGGNSGYVASIWVPTPVPATMFIIIKGWVTTSSLLQQYGWASAFVNGVEVAQSRSFVFVTGSTGGDDDLPINAGDSTTGLGRVDINPPGATISIQLGPTTNQRTGSGTIVGFLLKR